MSRVPTLRKSAKDGRLATRPLLPNTSIKMEY